MTPPPRKSRPISSVAWHPRGNEIAWADMLGRFSLWRKPIPDTSAAPTDGTAASKAGAGEVINPAQLFDGDEDEANKPKKKRRIKKKQVMDDSDSDDDDDGNGVVVGALLLSPLPNGPSLLITPAILPTHPLPPPPAPKVFCACQAAHG